MLTDTALRNLKPKEKAYKVTDRDGLYVSVLTSGTVSFRYNYSINGRQETLVPGRYGPGGLKLSEARELLAQAKKTIAAGRSPARQKAAVKKMRREENSFAGWAEEWLERHMMAESTRCMRRSVYERDLQKPFGKLKLEEISPEELRRLCDRIVERGAPATAVHAREVVMMVFRYARDRGEKIDNPADEVRPSSIARFQPRDRSLTGEEVCSMSGKGNCWDNAVAERFFLNLKMERVWQRNYANQAEAKFDVANYIAGFCNCQRLHSVLGNLPPSVYERKMTEKELIVVSEIT